MIRTISASDFKALLQSGKSVNLIDVRTPVEFREVHVNGARNEPLDRLDPMSIQADRAFQGDRVHEPIYIVCRSGARGKQACEKFLAAGITNVVNVEGGTMDCVTAGVPVTRGKKAIPLNCQVQIITGTLVTAGTILGIASSPYWLALPIGMGAGLLFSGLTNTCAMGTMLARMPWNQVKTSTPSTTGAANPTCTEASGVCCK